MARSPRPWYRASRDSWMVQIDGRRIELCRGRENKAEAERKFHALMAERLANPPADGGNPTVATILDAFLDHAIRHDAASTFYERRLYCQMFADMHGGRLVRDCLPYHLTAWVDAHPTWRSDWTRSYAIRVIKRGFNWAFQQGLIAKNPFGPVPHRPGAARRPITQAEYTRLLEAAGPTSRLAEVLRFLAFTGCRPSELRKLRWSETDLDQAVIILREHKTSRTQRVPQPRIIPLVPEVVELLKVIRERRESEEYVFVTHRKKPWSRCSLPQLLRRARRAIGLPEDVCLYSLRHQFCTSSIKAGVDFKTVSVLMGHTSTRMTERYSHLAGEHEHLAAAMHRATRSVSGA